MSEEEIELLMLSAMKASFMIQQHPIYVIVKESLPNYNLSFEQREKVLIDCEAWLLPKQESFIWSVRGAGEKVCLH